METFHERRYPNENEAYRLERNALLKEEIALREQMEKVAKKRRNLPPGGPLKKNYRLEEIDPVTGLVREVDFESLFKPELETLVVYSFMYGKDSTRPCDGCTPYLDGINASLAQAKRWINYSVIAPAPAEKLQKLADRRQWNHLRLLSTPDGSYADDYLGRTIANGKEVLWPINNVFVKKDGQIFHTWGSELLFAPLAEGAHPRHNDTTWAVWNLLDLTPNGRSNYFSRAEYY